MNLMRNTKPELIDMIGALGVVNTNLRDQLKTIKEKLNDSEIKQFEYAGVMEQLRGILTQVEGEQIIINQRIKTLESDNSKLINISDKMIHLLEDELYTG